MKRNLLIIGLFLLTIQVSAQENLTFWTVIKTDSVGKATIFASINDWFASSYNSAKDVIQMADKDAGIIIGNGSIEYNPKNLMLSCYTGYIKYTIKVYVKDNRYKVVLTNFIHTVNAGNSSSCELGIITTDDVYTIKGMNKKYQNKVWNDIKEKLENYQYLIFDSLKGKTKEMKKESEGDDW